MKRAADFLLLLLFAPIVVPLGCVVGLLVLARMGRPIFFRQLRPGLNGVPFELVKFRTMRSGKGTHTGDEADDSRLTTFGTFLRRTSLDELPELINILRGEMSFVGPRPLLMEYMSLYTPHQMRRHEVRPGLTGWAQINGRNDISWERRFDLDVWYVDHRTLSLDLRILLKTVQVVLVGQGISKSGHVTMERFRGPSP